MKFHQLTSMAFDVEVHQLVPGLQRPDSHTGHLRTKTTFRILLPQFQTYVTSIISQQLDHSSGHSTQSTENATKSTENATKSYTVNNN